MPNNRDYDGPTCFSDHDQPPRRSPSPAYRIADEIPPAELRWLWPQRLPHGAVTLLVGDPGVGKSLLAADIAARITRGDPWPVAPGHPPQPADFAHPASVVHAATQDATDSVILSRVTVARRQRVAILATAHLSKTPTHRPIYRVRGSLEYVSAARSVLLLTADAGDPTRRILHQIKSSYGPLAPTLSFHIIDPPPEPPAPEKGSQAYKMLSLEEKLELNPMTRKPRLPKSPSITWDDNPAPCLPPELLDISRERQCAHHEAQQWLKNALESGPRPAQELIHEAAKIGIAERTLYRAKLALNIASSHHPEFQKWSWWSL